MASASTILVVDDDPGMLGVASEELQSKGYTVIEAGNGLEALTVLSETKLDLIISDLEMPRMNGLDLVRAVRGSADEIVSQVPIIMLTGRGDDNAIQAAFDCGASSFVQKPVNWLNFLQHLNFILRAGSAESALRESHREVAKAAAARKELMTNLRHELRTPLHVITGYADLIVAGSGSADGEINEAAGFMRASALDINARLSKIFLLSDLIGGDLEFNIRPAHLREIVVAVRSELKNSKDLNVDGVTIDVPESLSHPIDQKFFMIALGSIIENAINFGNGTVIISQVESTDGEIVLQIADDGEGFDLQSGNNLLEAFSQGDAGLTRASTGLGLGLATAKMIVERHGGRIELTNSGDLGGGLVTVFLTTA